MGLEDRHLVCRRHGMRNECLISQVYANHHLKIWNLLEDGNLFNPVKDGHFDGELHFAQMISLMGPPPKEFLERSDRCREYWNAEGKVLPYSINASSFILTNKERLLDCHDTNT